MTMKAYKGNRAYTLGTRAEAKAYAERGFDVYEGGKLVIRGAGRVVPADLLDAAEARIAELEAELAGGKEPTKADLVAEAEGLGIEVPGKATKADILALIGAAKAETE